MQSAFHLSLGVTSLADSVGFFVDVLQAKVVHKHPSGYVNIDLFGAQITLKQNTEVVPNLADFHFGVNLDLEAFDELARHIASRGGGYVAMEPKVVDAGTSLERKKMYLKCPTGYVIELKGYKQDPHLD